MAEQYDLSAVRRLLSEAFNVGEISTLAFDLFPPVYGGFTAGMDREQMIRRIVEYASQRGKIPELLNYVQRENPYQYGRLAGQLRKNPSPQQPSTTSPQQSGAVVNPGSESVTQTKEAAGPNTAPEQTSELIAGIPAGAQPVETRPSSGQTNPTQPARSADKVDAPNPIDPRQRDVDTTLLILAVIAVLAVMIVSALVLRFVLEIRDVNSLVILLLIELPFVLVVIGKLTGQDFIGWLRSLFQRT